MREFLVNYEHWIDWHRYCDSLKKGKSLITNFFILLIAERLLQSNQFFIITDQAYHDIPYLHKNMH